MNYSSLPIDKSDQKGQAFVCVESVSLPRCQYSSFLWIQFAQHKKNPSPSKDLRLQLMIYHHHSAPSPAHPPKLLVSVQIVLINMTASVSSGINERVFEHFPKWCLILKDFKRLLPSHKRQKVRRWCFNFSVVLPSFSSFTSVTCLFELCYTASYYLYYCGLTLYMQ